MNNTGIDIYDLIDVNTLALLATFLHTIGVSLAIGGYVQTIIKANFGEQSNPDVYLLTIGIPNFYTISYVMGGLFIDILMTIRQIMPYSFCKEFSSAFTFALGITSASYVCRAGVLFFLSCDKDSKMFKRKTRAMQALGTFWFMCVVFHGGLAVDSYLHDTADLCTNLFGRVPVGVLFGMYGVFSVFGIIFTSPLLFTQTSYFMESVITMILYAAFVGSTLIVVAKYLHADAPALLSVFLNWTVNAVVVNIVQIYWKRWPKEIKAWLFWFCRCIPESYSYLPVDENEERIQLNGNSITDTALEFGHDEETEEIFNRKQYYNKDIIYNTVFSNNIWVTVDLPSKEPALTKGKEKAITLSNLQDLRYDTPELNSHNIQLCLMTLYYLQEINNTRRVELVSLLLFWRRVLYIIINPHEYYANLATLQEHKNAIVTIYPDLETVWGPLTTSTNPTALTQQLKGVCSYLGYKIEYLLRENEK